MATQRRSWLARIGVVAVVAVGALVGVTTPALPSQTARSAAVDLTPDQVSAGQDAELKFKVKNEGDTAANFTIAVDTPRQTSPEVACQGCNQTATNLGPGNEWTPQQIRIRGKASPGVSVRIRVTWPGWLQPRTSKQLTVAAATQSVGKIQGLVRNVADNKPIKGAIVTLVDGASKSHQTQADNNGIYSFDGPQRKIAPGIIAITAVKSPFTMVGGGLAKTVTLSAGQDAIPLDLSMEDLTISTPSPTPLDDVADRVRRADRNPGAGGRERPGR